ncbi:MAG: hypothetical protein PHZ25_03985, partial [Candidatus Pacebacteria bacterium]|nr:hypothetical protein [Candidatus Paceibacterota bacterium]
NFFVWRNVPHSERLFFKVAALRDGKKAIWTFLGSIPEGLSEPTRTPIPTVTSTPTNTLIPTPTATPTPTLTSTPVATATPTPSPTMLFWDNFPPSVNNFKNEDYLKWLRAGNFSNSPVWLAENSQVEWIRNEESDSADGFAVLSADGSLKNIPACFSYLFFSLNTFINRQSFLVLGIYAERNEKNKVLLPMIKYFYYDDNGNKIVKWAASAALPSSKKMTFNGRSFSGHFVSFLLENFSGDNSFFLSDEIYIFLQGENGSSPMLLIDYIGLLTVDEINMDVWNGNRAAVLELLNASMSKTGFSYCLPSLENLKKISGKEEIIIWNPVEYPLEE